MELLLRSLSDMGLESYIGLAETSPIETSCPFIVSRALGRSYCTEHKIVVIMNFFGFIQSLPQLATVGRLARQRFYILVVYSSKDEDLLHIKPRSIMFGMGFSVFKYTANYKEEDVVRGLKDVIPKINGPTCVFIEESSING